MKHATPSVRPLTDPDMQAAKARLVDFLEDWEYEHYLNCGEVLLILAAVLEKARREAVG